MTFGGGYAMLPIIWQTVSQFEIMSKEEFSNLAVCLPCALLTYLAVTFLKKKEKELAMEMVLQKMKIAGISLIAVSGFFLAEGSIYTGSFLSAGALCRIDPLQACLFLLTICLYYKTKMGPVLLTLAMAGISALVGSLF